MRVTNGMMSNRMMLNLYRNMSRMDNLNNQFSSTKRINFPSDDPILAARALKFRTSLRETEQYQRNVGQGISWMDTTERAFRSVTDIVNDMRDGFNRAINAEHELDQRLAIIAQMSQLTSQLGTAMNSSYAGRYVFSGFRTDQPPVFETNHPEHAFSISQSFRFVDMQLTDVAWREDTAPNEPIRMHKEIRLLKLPYAGGLSAFQTLDTSNLPASFNIELVSLSAAGAPNHVGDIVETLGLGDIRVVQETGEILIGKDVADWMQEGNQLQLSYVRTGFSRGELNPRIYFNSYDLIGSPIYKSGEPMDIMSFLSDFDALFPGAVDILPQLLGSLDNWTQVISSSNPDDVAEARSVFLRNFVNLLPDMNRDMLRELSVVHFFNDKDSITDQRLEFEFSMNTRIPINTLARDVFTSQLYADMHELIRYMTSLEAMLTPRSVLEELVKNVPANSNLDSEAISNQVKSREDAERRALNATAQSRFNVMLGRIDIHFAQISRQDADLGARMQRMELIEDRLVEDRLNFRQLISDNEDADLVEVSTALSMAQAAYEASLRVGANILQLTLADFIR